MKKLLLIFAFVVLIVSQCSDGQYFDVLSFSCKACNSNCKSCVLSASQCTNCSSSNFLSGNICIACTTNCLLCSESSCTTCILGYNIATNCQTCASGYTNTSGICIIDSISNLNNTTSGEKQTPTYESVVKGITISMCIVSLLGVIIAIFFYQKNIVCWRSTQQMHIFKQIMQTSPEKIGNWISIQQDSQFDPDALCSKCQKSGISLKLECRHYFHIQCYKKVNSKDSMIRCSKCNKRSNKTYRLCLGWLEDLKLNIKATQKCLKCNQVPVMSSNGQIVTPHY